MAANKPVEADALPYEKDALAPHLSKETLEFHYEKHHKGYVTKLNALRNDDAELSKKTVEQIVLEGEGAKGFNLAAQIWNHNFYWKSMSPKGGNKPTGKIADLINESFGSFEKFQEQFSAAAGGHFGSGWAWLVRDDNNKLSIVQTHDAKNPLNQGLTPVLTCDVWEHAFYIDYRNDKAAYVKAWWNLVNWEFANSNLKQ